MNKNSFQLLPHQIRTIEYIENRCSNQRGLILWHHMGTGKTITGLAWLYHIMTNYSENYYIFCPPLITSSWTSNAEKMGITLDKKRILNYLDLKIMIETNSNKIKKAYLVFDEVHNLVPIVRQLTTESRSYTSINNYLTSSEKLLLLTGTPFSQNKSDLAILINLCSHIPFMPLSEKKWIEKYADKSQFEKNKENPLYFNYFRPFFSKYGEKILYPIQNILYKIPGFQFNSYRDILWKIWVLPLFSIFLQPKIERVFDKVFETVEHTNQILDTQRFLKRVNPFEYAVNTYNKYIKNTNKQGNLFKYTKEEYTKNVPTLFYKSIIGVVGILIMTLINFTWSYLYQNINYGTQELRDLNYLPIDYEKVVDNIDRYISYYKFHDNPDYGKMKEIETPFRSILSLNSMILTIEFFFGKVAFNILSFITGRTVEDLTLDTDLVLNDRGYKVYGRVISNLPEFIGDLVTKKDNFIINKTTGNVTLKHFSKNVILEQSSTKFATLADHLQKQDSFDKKIVIYSDYIEQGAYLLSAYLNSRNIKHLYLNTKLLSNNQKDLLETFNKNYDYKIILLDKDSKEGISLLNIEELHFLEPSINAGARLQIIGRAIRYHSHIDLPESRRLVEIYTHSSSVFHSSTRKLSFLERLRSFNISEILFGNIKDSINEFKDNRKITDIIHQTKLKHFEGQFQTTISAYLDEFLDIQLNRTIQGHSLRGSRETESKNTNMKIDQNNETVILSVDEKLEQSNRCIGYEYNVLENLLSNNSSISDNFVILKEFSCNMKSYKIKDRFISSTSKKGGKHSKKNIFNKKNILKKNKYTNKKN